MEDVKKDGSHEEGEQELRKRVNSMQPKDIAKLYLRGMRHNLVLLSYLLGQSLEELFDKTEEASGITRSFEAPLAGLRVFTGGEKGPEVSLEVHDELADALRSLLSGIAFAPTRSTEPSAGG